MRTFIVRPITFVALLALTFVGASAVDAPAQVQSKDQQKCINKLNKAGAKVSKTQGKETDACIKGFFKGTLPGTAQACLTADLRLKLVKAKSKTISIDTKSCQAPSTPDFAYGGAGVVNTAATGESVALVEDIFGPSLDAALGNEKCQRAIVKAYEKIEKEKLKIFVKCKKDQLKAGVSNVTDLANACMGAIVADAKGKIAKRILKLADTFLKKCPAPGSVLDALFPGKCVGQPTVQAWATCIDVEVEGRVCAKLAEMDVFGFDCDLFDDGVVCNSGDQTGDETDVDCGGSCPACGDGLGCAVPADCQSLVCTGNVCQAPICTDGVQNQDETDIDCGGSTCAACPDGGTCVVGGDCQSGICLGNVCQVPECVDGVQNGDETDVDCGGGTCMACPDGGGCAIAADCTSGVCTGNVCQVPTCSDGVQNQDEGDIDCGGATCADCPDGSSCNLGTDCESGVCTGNVCQVPTCTDGVQNGDETDIDCGGSCPACPDGAGCGTPADCTSGVCTGNICQVPTCLDGVVNQDETDIDCGGATCAACPDGGGCLVGPDCQSMVCAGNVCQAPTCFDSTQNANETDVDCGGGTCPVCNLGEGCLVGGDCFSSVCVGAICSCGNTPFTFNVSSNSGGLFDSAEWPGGTQSQTTVDPACSVTINNPNNNIDLVCTLAAPFSINGFTGFSSCFGTGGEDGDGCQPGGCPPLGIGSCCSGRPSCSAALNGSGNAQYFVQCLN